VCVCVGAHAKRTFAVGGSKDDAHTYTHIPVASASASASVSVSVSVCGKIVR